MKIVLFLLVAVAIGWFATACAQTGSGGSSNAPTIDGERARELVSEGAVLLDVRTPGEFSSGHIDGAINIPVQSLSSRLDDVPEGPVVLYCRSGNRSSTAGRMLLESGRTEVYDLGGMGQW